MEKISSLLSGAIAFVKQSIKSFIKFGFICIAICCAVGFAVNVLYMNKMLGPDCRYYGDAVHNCYFMRKNIDWLSEIFLTAWALPFIGPIVAILMPPMLGVMLTLFFWPIYYGIRLAIQLIKRLFQKT